MKTAKEPRHIYLYRDGKHNLYYLENALNDLSEKYDIEWSNITAKHLFDQNFVDVVLPDNVLLMPGGQGKIFTEQLGKKGFENIRQAVSKGATYWGICAGAYMACRHINWHDYNRSEKIKTDNTFNLIPIRASGPIFGLPRNKPDSHKSFFTVAGTTICLPQQEQLQCAALYEAGPQFSGLEGNSDIKVIATMTDRERKGKTELPAIIETTYGEGRVIVSSLHFEVCGDDIKMAIYKPDYGLGRHLNMLAPILNKHEESRLNAWRKLGQYIAQP